MTKIKVPAIKSDYLYTHSDPNGKIFYVGVGRASRPFQRSTRNQRWNDYVDTLDYFEVDILFWLNDSKLLYKREKALIMELRPFCNHLNNPDRPHPLKGIKCGRPNRKIVNGKIVGVPLKCNETGESFSSIYSAARAFDVSGSAISYNLRGQKNGKLKGYTFSLI
ncbi:MAG: hypothetical protein DRQ35_06930 [Gammaproteobacteria bacterium]|nr:MAG: hypothetical protein DRQ35_06930 [Gammaproteobacteria bacterium]